MLSLEPSWRGVCAGVSSIDVAVMVAGLAVLVARAFVTLSVVAVLVAELLAVLPV